LDAAATSTASQRSHASRFAPAGRRSKTATISRQRGPPESLLEGILPMSNNWHAETIRVLDMNDEGRRRWLADLLYELSTMARDTYEVGGDTLNDPKRMRRFNELIRRTANQLRNKSRNYSSTPDDVFMKLVGDEVEALGFSATRLAEALVK
jgi:hypothetical protein